MLQNVVFSIHEFRGTGLQFNGFAFIIIMYVGVITNIDIMTNINEIFMFGLVAMKYENIISIPPMQIRKIKNDIQVENNVANRIAANIAIIKIHSPSCRGEYLKKAIEVVARIIDITKLDIIYKLKTCTLSIDVKYLCALYTNLY